MKGLTPLEKTMIEQCCSTYEPSTGEADEGLLAVCEKLASEGRLAKVQVLDAEGKRVWIYQATDLGRSALRNAIVKAP